MFIAGAGMFGIFLFVTYYLQTSLGYSPIQTGLAFLPMIASWCSPRQLSTNLLLPRFGPKAMVPFGMALAAAGMVYLTRLDAQSTYAADVLPPLMIIGFGMGSIVPASMQTATFGVDRPVRRRRLGDGQHEPAGGRVHRHRAAQHARRDRRRGLRRATTPPTEAVLADAAIHSYAVAYWWGAGFFAVGAVLAAPLFRRRGDGPSLAIPREGEPESARWPRLTPPSEPRTPLQRARLRPGAGARPASTDQTTDARSSGSGSETGACARERQARASACTAASVVSGE